MPSAAVAYTLQLMPETLYLTCNIIDRYLSIRNVTRKRLQLVSTIHTAWVLQNIVSKRLHTSDSRSHVINKHNHLTALSALSTVCRSA
jgi:hypothetical protein